MLRSMFSGVSGLRTHQVMMDVIGNNIANVNTAGYKSGSVVFQDLLSQLLRGAGGPVPGLGGTNPAQVGLGVRLAGITTSFGQGALQLTGRSTDMAIQGDGFFVTELGGQQLYTRAGAFSFDTEGKLVTADGAVAQGWAADPLGNIDKNQPLTDLKMPLGQTLAPVQTQNLKLGGNLPADAAVGATVTSSIKVYDAQGTQISVTFQFTKTAADQWSVQAESPDATGTLQPVGAPAALAFDPDTGALTAPPGYTITPPGVWDANGIAIDFGTAAAPDALSQFSGTTSVAALSQDGSALGTLQSFSIGQDGVVTGVFSNGRTQAIGQLALASFNNPAGLEKAGGAAFRATANSGLAQIGSAGSGGRGLISGGMLEMSNVDLAQEFTNLIVAQRGFQANSRVITASDELLQDLVNLKR
jgi:flagellar hook protein FlgE